MKTLQWGILLALPLLFSACSYYKNPAQENTLAVNLTVERAKSYYDTYCTERGTRVAIDDRIPFILGDAEWLWSYAEGSSYDYKSAIDIPIRGGYEYKVYRQQSDGTYVSVSTSSKVVAVQDNTTDAISFYIRVSIPDVEDENAVNRTLNFEDKIGYNGLEYYITLDGCPAAITKFKDGVQIDGVFLGDETIDKREKIYKFANMLRGVCIARCSGTTRSDPEMEYGKDKETFVDQFGQLYVYVDLDGDGLGDAVCPIFPEDIECTIHFGSADTSFGGSDTTGSNNGFNSTGSTGTGSGAGSNTGTATGTGSGVGAAAGGIGGAGGVSVGTGTDTEAGTTTGSGSGNENNDSATDTTLQPGTTTVAQNIVGQVNPTKQPKKFAGAGVKLQTKSPINLGDSKKFVTYRTNGQTNCFTLCKMILDNYGIENYGSPNNVFKLMYEADGVLKHYGDNVQQNYQNAIDCIDRHLEAGRPIIVGVNHKIGQIINEKTTDHFVVIYGRVYDLETGYYHYLYYDVCTGHTSIGYNDNSNRFIYRNTNPPYLYDDVSPRTDKKRYDVIQVRPNDGNIEGTIRQDSK
ncbi:MAG: hypothetical protein E7143_05805 [Rikenellaceae bacterium]|nr:hypothetical protein [Rikenellaceae bacterium]